MEVTSKRGDDGVLLDHDWRHPRGSTRAPVVSVGARCHNGAMFSSPFIIAHRGASGERPEHTLAAYELAIAQGADFVEPDLVATRDGVLVARHENEIAGTTDVATHPEFADRRARKIIDGAAVEGWFTEDFTLAELKSLRARERLPAMRPGNTAYDGLYEIPTFAEILALAARAGVGVYPETKHPSYFRAIGLPLDETLFRQIEAAGLDRADAPLFIQSFEVANLQALRTTTHAPLVQLIAAEGAPACGGPSYARMITPEGLRAVAAYADAIGPDKRLVVGDDGAPTRLVADAHAAGLRVHPWTYRAENQFLPPALQRGDDPAAYGALAAELGQAFDAGVDGLFCDFPGVAVTARAAWTGARPPA